MSRNRIVSCTSYALLGGLILALGAGLLAQGAPDRILVVNGRDTTAVVRQIDGRSYVELETLAQLTKGAITVEPTRIVLTIPAAPPVSTSTSTPATGSTAGPSQTANVPPGVPVGVPPGLTRDFARTAIAELAEMREWRGAIGTMVTYGLAVSGGWAQEYHERVQAGLMQATIAATSESDQNAVQLLNNEFNRLAGWAADVIAARQALNGAKTVDPNALQNDAVLAKITECGIFLNSMLVSGVFADNASCH
jgi:hypothetical protein